MVGIGPVFGVGFGTMGDTVPQAESPTAPATSVSAERRRKREVICNGGPWIVSGADCAAGVRGGQTSRRRSFVRVTVLSVTVPDTHEGQYRRWSL